MSVTAFERVVRIELEDQLKSIEEGLLSGVDSIEEYRQRVGERRGLIRALTMLSETLKKFDAQ